MDDLVSSHFSACAQYVMVGVPDDFIFPESAAIFLQPTTDPIPGDYRVENACECINGKGDLAGYGTGVVLGDEVQTMFGRLPLGLSEGGDKVLYSVIGSGGVTKPPSR